MSSAFASSSLKTPDKTPRVSDDWQSFQARHGSASLALILVSAHGLSSGGDVDKSTDDTGLGICDLDGLVGADKEEGVDPLGVALHSLLVDQDRLVGNHAVKETISLDTRGDTSI